MGGAGFSVTSLLLWAPGGVWPSLSDREAEIPSGFHWLTALQESRGGAVTGQERQIKGKMPHQVSINQSIASGSP